MNLHAGGLENDWVRFEPFTLDHVECLKSANAVEAMWARMPDIPKGKSPEAYGAHMCDLQKRGEAAGFAMFRQSDNAFAGVANFEQISKIHRRLDIANFWHPEEMRGSGIFQASQSLLIRRALDWGARRIGWMIPVEAEPALRAVERMGARQEGVLRSFYRLAGGGWADMAVLALLREEAEMALHRMAVARELAEGAPGHASLILDAGHALGRA